MTKAPYQHCPKCKAKTSLNIRSRSAGGDLRDTWTEVQMFCPECGWQGGAFSVDYAIFEVERDGTVTDVRYLDGSDR